MEPVVILHNPRCSKSRAALGLLEERGVPLRVVRYLDAPPTLDELDRIINLLGIEPRALMRRNETVYEELGLDNPELGRAELLAAMVAHPILIERPVVLANGKAVIGRPPERVLEVL